MRKNMSKEVTVTTVRIGQLKMVEGELQAVELKPLRLLGRISKEKAQQIVDKNSKLVAQVLEVKTESHLYEMDVFDFIKHATIKDNKDTKEGETK